MRSKLPEFTDLPVEEDGFEPSVPPEKGPTSSRCSTFQHFPSERDRGFESVSLQRRVCEPPVPQLTPSDHVRQHLPAIAVARFDRLSA